MKRLSLFLLFFCLADILKADNNKLIQYTLNNGYPPHSEGTSSFNQSDRTDNPLDGQKFKAHPFPLQDVRLLEGPFKSAMELHIQVLLAMDPDRLLFNFRVNAGLPVTAEPLGNWESPGSELRGHLTGHYLSACALMVAASGDNRFKERAAYVVSELDSCQKALGTSGYLSAFPESFFDRLETSGRVWAPYYTLHKILAGLIDVHNLCDNAQALEMAVRMGDWVTARTDKLNDDEMQKMLAVEHGGINEALANLYALTGEEKYLRTAKRLYHKRVLDPLAAGEDKLAGLHANTQFPKVIGLASLYDLTGEASFKSMSEFFWDRVVNHHSYVIGGNSDHEGFGPPDMLYSRVSPFTAETCNTYNMLKLTRRLFAWDALATQADFYERALYNHILPSQNPHSGRMAYHVPVNGGWFMPYDTPNESAWCCTGTGLENHAKYGDSIYWYDDEGIFVNLFIPSELNWRDKSIILQQETRYPEEDIIRLKLQCSEPIEMNLRVRYPSWAQRGMEIKINGESFPHNGRSGIFIGIKRTWKSGDLVEVKIPMNLRLEPMPDNPTRAAICFGPVVLAG
ncbi:MAG: glycoside hydrolase family 127 protein, partial [Calditrichaeota bacterium]